MRWGRGTGCKRQREETETHFKSSFYVRLEFKPQYRQNKANKSNKKK
jgi:hypothetical protein